MFRVVEKTYNTPIRMIARPGVRFVPGRMAKVYTLESGTLACDIGDRNNVFGVIGSYRFIRGEDPSFAPEDMVELWIPRMVFRTDQYDKKHEYKTGDTLYSNDKGLFTVDEPYQNASYVARVITGSDEIGHFFEALWI